VEWILPPPSRIAADTGLAWLHRKHAEAAEFDAIALLERALHLLEHGLDSHFGFRLRNSGFADDFVDDVELDQKGLPLP